MSQAAGVPADAAPARIVLITQVVDADHPALAQTLDMVDALARRCDEVVVLCDRVGRHGCPSNVRLLTFGTRSRMGRGLAFERLLAAELRHRGTRPTGVIAHMAPVFLTLAAPLCKLYRVPLGLWYTHTHVGPTLRLATRLANVVFSVDRRSFPLDTPKVRGIGHAIDVAQFAAPAASGAPPEQQLRLLGLGRMTPWKGFATILRGLELARGQGLDAELEIRGPTLTPGEVEHLGELRAIVEASAALGEHVRLGGPVPREQVPALFARAQALVSATEPSLDKAVYEAAAAGLPVVSSNPLLADFLGGLPLELRFHSGDPEDLARILTELDAAGPDVRAAVGLELRSRVVAGHSTEAWADAVVNELGAAGRGRRTGGVGSSA